ncbi:MAG: STAS domain-containing protein [Bacilli bacterium]|nr:STAS domain-containing protein [Bacilli bacterium]
MTIEKKFNGESLTLLLIGRLDTTTSPDLEREIQESTKGIKSLTLDFKDLEYISSAGLRVVLGAQKLMSRQGQMNLINVPDAIKDIFEMTGFSEILNIE